MVSPDILGVSGGAGLGAVLAIFLSLPVLGIQLLAFLAGLGTVGLVLLVAASVRGREPVLVLVLAGVVVGALAGALISLLKVMADPYDQLPAITFLAARQPGQGQAGGLGDHGARSWRWAWCPALSALAHESDVARRRGSRGARRGRPSACASCSSSRRRADDATVVAISGIIGWVGLIMPHIARMLVGPNFPIACCPRRCCSARATF